MADIELVIKVDESDVDLVRKNFKPMGYSFIPLHIQTEFVSAILNGTPLPKGHKRLIEDNFEVGHIFDKDGNRIGYKYVTQEDLNNALTIIEADKEQEHDT